MCVVCVRVCVCESVCVCVKKSPVRAKFRCRVGVGQ